MGSKTTPISEEERHLMASAFLRRFTNEGTLLFDVTDDYFVYQQPQDFVCTVKRWADLPLSDITRGN